MPTELPHSLELIPEIDRLHREMGVPPLHFDEELIYDWCDEQDHIENTHDPVFRCFFQLPASEERDTVLTYIACEKPTRGEETLFSSIDKLDEPLRQTCIQGMIKKHTEIYQWLGERELYLAVEPLEKRLELLGNIRPSCREKNERLVSS